MSRNDIGILCVGYDNPTKSFFIQKYFEELDDYRLVGVHKIFNDSLNIDLLEKFLQDFNLSLETGLVDKLVLDFQTENRPLTEFQVRMNNFLGNMTEPIFDFETGELKNV